MRRHLLIVAADEHLCVVLAQALMTAGDTVVTVGSANDALQVALLEAFDTILVDMALLLADPDLVQRLRTLGVTTPVLPIPTALVQRAAAIVQMATPQPTDQPLQQRVGQPSLRPRLWSAGGHLDGRHAARPAPQAAAVSRTNLPAMAANPGPAQAGEAVRAASSTGSASASTAPSAPGQAESRSVAAPPQIGQRIDARV